MSAVMGRRWPDVGPGECGDRAREVLDQEASRFAVVLRRGVDHLQSLADEDMTFDGDLAFRFADTLGYPVELSAEEAAPDRDGDRSGLARRAREQRSEPPCREEAAGAPQPRSRRRQIRRRSLAQAVSWWRLLSCSLRSTAETWVSIVFTDRCRRLAISL